jgi:hypothetical protein
MVSALGGGGAFAQGRANAAGDEFYPDLFPVFPGQAALAGDPPILREQQHELAGQRANLVGKDKLSAEFGHVSERALESRRSVGKVDPDPPLQRFALLFSFFGTHRSFGPLDAEA